MSARAPGRPRSESARRAILGAATSLTARDGYGRLTIEAIAREAGVSKQTIYRWWPTKAAVVLEALNDAASTIAPPSDTGSLEGDLRLFLRRSVAGASGRNAHLLAALMAAAQLDEAFAESFRSGFLARRRQVLRELLERGRQRGEMADRADPGFLTELVFGGLWYRMLAGNAQIDRRFADKLTDAVLTLATAPPPR
jgi:AcrR family transcriptional regulator